MSVINEVCGSDNNSTTKNLGGKKQCLEAPVKTTVLARENFYFPDLATAKGKAAWDAAKENKDVIPMPYIEGIEANNTEASIKNGRFQDYKLKEGIRGSSYRYDVSICTYAGLKSYENSEYTRIFRITTEGEVTCEVAADGKVYGEKISSMLVGIREEAKDDDVPYSNVAFKYANELFSIIKPGFSIEDMEGIFDVVLKQVSATSTEIKFTAQADCTGDFLKSFVSASVQLLAADGTPVTGTTFAAPDANGVYTLTGTGFVTGMTLSLVGIVTQANIMYETPEALTITV